MVIHPPGLTPAMQDYLKEIFHLSEGSATIGTSVLASRLDVAAPSVTHMVKRLADLQLVDHSPYRGIELTPVGRAIAVEVVRHHRLIELYLSVFLDVPWSRVHEEADRLEHVISEDLEARMAEKLGEPEFDPHGDPIPDHAGSFPDRITASLWETPPGEHAVLTRVRDQNPDLLLYLQELHLLPGARLLVMRTSLYGGTQTVLVEGVEQVIGRDLATNLLVSPATRSDAERWLEQ